MSFRRFIEKADRAGYLVTVDRPVDTTFELANVAHALEGRPVLFNHVTGYPGWRVCAGPCSDRAYFSLDLDVAAPDLLRQLARAIAQPVAPPLADAAPCQEVVSTNATSLRASLRIAAPTTPGRRATATCPWPSASASRWPSIWRPRCRRRRAWTSWPWPTLCRPRRWSTA
jgi:hypothetical protein